jgi:hypothetical protein
LFSAVPDAGQVGDELGDPVFLGLGERAGVPFSGLVVSGLVFSAVQGVHEGAVHRVRARA